MNHRDRRLAKADEDAPERLREKIAALEAQMARRKAINAAIRKGPGWEARMVLTDDEKAELLNHARAWAPYSLSNLGGQITKARERLAGLEARNDRQIRAAEAGIAEWVRHLEAGQRAQAWKAKLREIEALLGD
jgi:hypothetical protein